MKSALQNAIKNYKQTKVTLLSLRHLPWFKKVVILAGHVRSSANPKTSTEAKYLTPFGGELPNSLGIKGRFLTVYT